MGTDINGWVDVKDPQSDRWQTTILIERLVNRNYGVFGSLFGHRNIDGFRPLAAHRGVPPDLGPAAWGNLGYSYDDVYMPTWVLWSEVAAIDQEEEGSNVVHRYIGEMPEPWEAPDSKPSEYKRWKRKEVMDDSWDTRFALMEVLARRYGGDSVRLVVWFDS